MGRRAGVAGGRSRVVSDRSAAILADAVRAGGLGGLTDRLVELYGAEQAGRMLSFAPPADAGEALTR